MWDRVFFFIFYFYRSLRRSRAQVQLKNIGWKVVTRWTKLTGESQRKLSSSTKFPLVSPVCLNFLVDGSSSRNCGGKQDSRGEICVEIISNLI